MTVLVGRLVVLTLVSASLGVASASNGVSACSCRVTEPLHALLAADTIVVGETIGFVDNSTDERVDRHWLVRVHERWRGDTTDTIAIDLDIETGDCGDTRTVLPGVLALEDLGDGRYHLPGCYTGMSHEALRSFFEPPPEPDGTGPPHSISAIDVGGHNLVVIDEQRRPLRYLEGAAPTFGLSACPGGTHFVQVRGSSVDRARPQMLELVRWRLDDWSIVDVTPIDSGARPFQLPVPVMCGRADGLDVTMALAALRRYVDGEPVPTFDSQGPSVAGPGGLYLSLEASQWMILRVSDGDNSELVAEVEAPDDVAGADPWFDLVSIESTDTHWRLSLLTGHPPGLSTYSRFDVFPDGAVVPIDIVAGFDHGGTQTLAVIDPTVAVTLTIDPGPRPTALFERSGDRVDRPPPTLPPAQSIEEPTGGEAEPPTDVAAVTDVARAREVPDADSRTTGLIGLSIVVAVAAVAGGWWLRARHRRRQTPA